METLPFEIIVASIDDIAEHIVKIENVLSDILDEKNENVLEFYEKNEKNRTPILKFIIDNEKNNVLKYILDEKKHIPLDIELTKSIIMNKNKEIYDLLAINHRETFDKSFKDLCGSMNEIISKSPEDKDIIINLFPSIDDRYHVKYEDILISYSINIEYEEEIKEVTLEEGDICCICHSEPNLITNCGHYGCDECFQKIGNTECPCCRSSINKYYKIKL